MNPSDSENGKIDNRENSPEIEQGTLISHYRIDRKIGSGGMGEVYRAEDVKLNRRVALKFLPVWLKNDPQARDRLLNEARTASQVNHPNLVSIYSIEQEKDRDFIVMEYVEGKRLSEIIRRSDLTLKQRTEIIIKIASGLKAAHDKGIIHRDIKPDNIVITGDGQVKILDFGLAVAKDSLKESTTEKMSGTLVYLSPEQVQNQSIDHRSDIFSLGVLMYELYCGFLPFKGEYEAAIIYSIANEEPPPLPRKIPEVIGDVVYKALEKNPDNRYQDISDLITDLEESRAVRQDKPSKTGVGRQVVRTFSLMILLLAFSFAIYFIFSRYETTDDSRQIMLAVLPLDNLGMAEDEYFAEGITDAIITELANSPSMGVISLSSTIHYKDTKKDIKQIGEELGADYILTGTIQWLKNESPGRIKINPKLIKVKDNAYLWAQTYEPALSEIFSLQDEIAKEVTSALDLKISEQQDSRERAPSTKNVEAYSYYLKGNMYYYRGWEEKDLLIAVEMYEKAITLDPDFVEAYAMLSRTHSCIFRDYYDLSDSRINMARSMIDRALAIAPDLIEVKLALGTYYYSRMEYEPALDLFLEVLRYQPNNIEAVAGVAGVYRRQGMPQQAIDYYMKAYRLDPRSNIRAFDVSLTYCMMRYYPEAINYLDKSISLAPDWPMAYILKTWLYLFWKGDVGSAREIITDASSKANLEQSEYYWWLLRIIESDYDEAIRKAQLKSDTTSYYLHLARLYRMSGQESKQIAYYDSAKIVLQSKIKLQPENARLHSQLGLAYAGLGKKELAIEHGLKATSILTPSQEAIYSLFFLVNLAEIYVLVGEDEKAIDQLEYSMAIPGFVSPPYLRQDPVWKPLHENPRFKKLIDNID